MKVNKNEITDYLLIIAGTALTALGIVLFLDPAELAPGGVSGIAIILSHVTGFSVGTLMLYISVPIYFLGVAFFGKKYGIKVLTGTVLASLFTILFDDILGYEGILDYSKDMSYWLSALYGGLLTGVGIGLVFKAGSNTGGTDIIGQIISNVTHLPIGTSLMITDGTIIFASLFIFGVESALYSIFEVIVVSLIIDKAILPLGTGYAKTVYILSENMDKISEYILKTMDRSGTLIDAEGLFLKKKKKMLMTIIPNMDLPKLVKTVREADPKAFMIIQDTIHVLGEGYADIKSIKD